MLYACVFLVAVAFPLKGQGVLQQEYSGLDKYMEQGRPGDMSFAGVRAAEFLSIPVGARGIAMGSAFSAVSDDITSIWWNPAGLGFLQKRELMVTVVDYTMDLTYSYAGFASPIGDGNLVLGGFFGYLDIPNTEITTVEQPLGTGDYYDAYDFQMGGSLAYNLSDRFSTGINVKYVHQDMWANFGGNAFAIDAGGIYHTDFMDREIRFAFSVQNLGTNVTMRGPHLIKDVGPENRDGDMPSGYGDFSGDPNAIQRRAAREMMYVTHAYRLPTVVKLALSYNILTSEQANWLASGEFWRNSHMPVSYSAGTEYVYNFSPYLSGALRMGWKIQMDEFTQDNDEFGYQYWGDDPTYRGLSFGGGFKRVFGSNHIEFSYAYRNKGRLSSDNFFTITLGF